ncbi:MAG TPA: hypothetical protein VLZ83_02995 [Edaphocola sp.]|nr:hypothetical protein [Edaphocola sp.]
MSVFRVKAEIVDTNFPYLDYVYCFAFFDHEIEAIQSFDVENDKRINIIEIAAVFPANLYLAPKDYRSKVIYEIQDALFTQEENFKRAGKLYRSYFSGPVS